MTDLFSSAEGSESEGTFNQYRKVLQKKKPIQKKQTNIKTPSPNPKLRMTSTPIAPPNPSPNPQEGTEIVLTPELELLEKKTQLHHGS